MCDHKIHLRIRLLPDVIQQVIDPLAETDHGLPALIAVDKTGLGILKLLSVSRRGLVFPEILFLKPWLNTHGDSRNF